MPKQLNYLKKMLHSIASQGAFDNEFLARMQTNFQVCEKKKKKGSQYSLIAI